LGSCRLQLEARALCPGPHGRVPRYGALASAHTHTMLAPLPTTLVWGSGSVGGEPVAWLTLVRGVACRWPSRPC
jgi:hypothetical protein